jgi:sugar/nucleoside kinase (ribokinase family)
MIEHFMDRYQQLKICIVTLGESGACFGLSEKLYSAVSRAVNIVDTICLLV